MTTQQGATGPPGEWILFKENAVGDQFYRKLNRVRAFTSVPVHFTAAGTIKGHKREWREGVLWWSQEAGPRSQHEKLITRTTGRESSWRLPHE